MKPSPFTLLTGSRNYSSWSLRAWLALRLSGLPFRERVFDLRGPERADIKSASPSAMVPCLIVPRAGGEDLYIWDSLAICEYLAELAPEAQLWPAEQDKRAWARSVAAEMHSGFGELRRNLSMDICRRFQGHEITPETQRQAARIQKIWTDCRAAHRDKGDFLFGSFGIADCFYAPVVTRFQSYGVKLSGPAAEYSAAVLSWAAMREWSNNAAREEADRAA